MSRGERGYYAFFLNKKGNGNMSIWPNPLYGPYEYERIDGHGNEWYDLFHEGYELWICELTLDGKKENKEMKKKIKPELVMEEIKNDFAADGELITLKHKYHGKWLVVEATSITDELPTTNNDQDEEFEVVVNE